MDRHCDFLVLGSGLAGLTFALRASEFGSVFVITKRAGWESNTNYAQGGIAAVMGPDDTPDAHVEDTLRAGAGLCRRDVVETVVRGGAQAIADLQAFGVEFTRDGAEDRLALGREGGHSARRIVHAQDATGQAVETALLEAVTRSPHITLFENHAAIDLITRSSLSGAPRGSRADDRCWGAYVLDERTGAIDSFTAPVTFLATGGAGKVYVYTTNPDVATGDGVAMAWRAGVRVANLEFFQFHPTCLYHPAAKSFLITEAVRGEGGVLTTMDGASFMERYHEMASLAPRDVVARAIDEEMKRRGDPYVYLDARAIGADTLRRRFPMILDRCASFGIDVTRDPIPVVPAAHYMCGGVRASVDGRTELPGLLAVGEVACTGLHGANRLASNSLLEAVVGGRLAVPVARAALADAGPAPPVPAWNVGRAAAPREAIGLEHAWNEVRQVMWDYVGIVRSMERLDVASRKLAVVREEIAGYYWRYTITTDLIELRNIALVAELIVRCAQWRRESRGLHYLLDEPLPDPQLDGVDTLLTPVGSRLARVRV